MGKQTPINTIPARSKSVDKVGQGKNTPIHDLARALARRRARLDALPPAPANLNDEAASKEKTR